MSRDSEPSQGSRKAWEIFRGSRPAPRGSPAVWKGTGHRSGLNPGHEPDKPPQEEPVGDLVTSFDTSELPRVETHPTISDCEYVASYNWVDGKVPTILVPGQ